MRQLAYLRSKEEGAKETRLKIRQVKGWPIELPPLEGHEYLVSLWEEAGTAGQGMSGLVPLEFSEVAAWLDLTQTQLTPWELSTIVKMSRQYCYQSAISGDKMCESPYKMEVTEDVMVVVREAADKKLRSMF